MRSLLRVVHAINSNDLASYFILFFLLDGKGIDGKHEVTYLVVVKKDLVARLLGATAAPLPRARYVRLVLAF